MQRLTVGDVLAVPHTWYHTIDLGDGVTTPGWIDIRHVTGRTGLDDDLRGKRALDVGMFDGFWAFDLERRGATVVGIDIDEIPPPDAPGLHRTRVQAEATTTQGAGFAVLKAYFGSAVERIAMNVYDLTPDAIGGPVDVVVVGALLLHLRDPVRALERIRGVLAPGGVVVLVEAYDPKLPARRNARPEALYMAYDTPWTWWLPNRACLRHWLLTAQFTSVVERGTHTAVDVHRFRHHLVVIHARSD